MSASEHISIDRVRAYLLGTLDAADADRLEDTYFCERAALLRVQRIETGLIRDYLDGKLSNAELAAFEGRYLKAPALKKRIEQVRQEGLKKTSPWYSVWRPVLAAAALVCLIGIAAWLSSSTHSKPVLLALSPGVTMGSSSSPTVFTLPKASTPVRLVLELPGQNVPILCVFQLLQVMPEGKPKLVWTSHQPQLSEAIAGGQQVAFTIESREIGAQDYVVEVTGPDGNVLESYVFSGRTRR